MLKVSCYSMLLRFLEQFYHKLRVEPTNKMHPYFERVHDKPVVECGLAVGP